MSKRRSLDSQSRIIYSILRKEKIFIRTKLTRGFWKAEPFQEEKWATKCIVIQKFRMRLTIMLRVWKFTCRKKKNLSLLSKIKSWSHCIVWMAQTPTLIKFSQNQPPRLLWFYLRLLRSRAMNKLSEGLL